MIDQRELFLTCNLPFMLKPERKNTTVATAIELEVYLRRLLSLDGFSQMTKTVLELE